MGSTFSNIDRKAGQGHFLFVFIPLFMYGLNIEFFVSYG